MPLFGNKEKPSVPSPFSPKSSPSSPSLGRMFRESLFGSRPTPPSQNQSPIPPKRSFGVLESLGLRPMPKPEQKPQANAPVPFEKSQYRPFKELQGFARGIREEQVPGQSGKVYKKEAQEVEKTIEEYAKKSPLGGPYGIKGFGIGSTKEAYGTSAPQSVLGRMQKDVLSLKKAQKFQEAKKLFRKIKIIEQWQKRGFK